MGNEATTWDVPSSDTGMADMKNYYQWTENASLRTAQSL